MRLPPRDELARRWAEVEPHLRRATDRTGCYEPIDLLAAAIAGRMGIWVAERDGAIDAAIVTEIRQYPRRRVLEVPFIGGRNLRGWVKPLLDVLDAHGRAAGCSHIAGSDRKGWARVGGFTVAGVLLVRDL